MTRLSENLQVRNNLTHLFELLECEPRNILRQEAEIDWLISAFNPRCWDRIFFDELEIQFYRSPQGEPINGTRILCGPQRIELVAVPAARASFVELKTTIIGYIVVLALRLGLVRIGQYGPIAEKDAERLVGYKIPAGFDYGEKLESLMLVVESWQEGESLRLLSVCAGIGYYFK